MTKEGGFVHNWKRRWFIMSEDKIEYYTDKNGTLRGSFPLNSDTMCEVDTTAKMQPAFKISWPNQENQKRIYRICCENTELREQWMEAINNVLDQKKNG